MLGKNIGKGRKGKGWAIKRKEREGNEKIKIVKLMKEK